MPKTAKPKPSLFSKQRRWLLKVLATALLAVIVVGGAVWFVHNYYLRNLEPVSTSQKTEIVTIKSGANLPQIASLLREKKLIRNAQVFSQYVRGKNVQGSLQAGTYSLSPSQSVPEIVTILTHGNILKNLFTILPGQRLDQIKSALINAGFAQADVEAALNPSLYTAHSSLADLPAGASLEGYLYPDSFQKIATTTPETIINQSLDEMDQKLTPQIRDAFVEHGLTVHEGVTLASIVEREVSNSSDRPTVAQVFLSRLQNGMHLESDVATMYGDILAGQPLSATYDTPYNVFLHGGLPVGPISNVSADALQAVANPAPTDWIYFVSGDDGKTYFSKTLEDHQALTQQYCKKLCN